MIKMDRLKPVYDKCIVCFLWIVILASLGVLIVNFIDNMTKYFMTNNVSNNISNPTSFAGQTAAVACNTAGGGFFHHTLLTVKKKN